MAPFFQDCRCHKLCVLKTMKKTFSESREETVGWAEKKKRSGLWDQESEPLISKPWRSHLWYGKCLWIDQGESLLQWVMLPEGAASIGYDPDSGSPHPGKVSFCYQNTLPGSKRDCRQISTSLWEGRKRVPYSGNEREVMVLVTAINCFFMSHKL